MKTNKIKILFLLPHLKAGGAERVVSFLFMRLNRAIFDPYLVVIGFKEESHYTIEAENIIYLNKERLRSALFDIIKLVRKVKPNIAFSSIGHINIYMGVLSIFFPKTIFIAREASVYSKMSSFNNKKQLPMVVLKKCYLRLNALVYQSNDMKKDFEQTFKIHPSKGHLIANPITTPSRFIKEPLKKSTFPIKFFIVGSLVLNKGHERVLKMLEHVDFDFELHIIGEGPLREKLEQRTASSRIKDKIIFRGLQKNMPQLYTEADFLIQGSYVEGFPNVILEALSFGIPCLVFDAPGGHREMITDTINGFIIPTEDQAPQIIEKAIRFNWDRIAIQKDVQNRFGAEKIIKQYETMFLNMVNQ